MRCICFLLVRLMPCSRHWKNRRLCDLILATTEVHKIPITILSRCQHYDFKRISIETITGRMRDLMQEEQVEVEEKALRYVAKAADGSMRDALSLLDQCIAFIWGRS